MGNISYNGILQVRAGQSGSSRRRQLSPPVYTERVVLKLNSYVNIETADELMKSISKDRLYVAANSKKEDQGSHIMKCNVIDYKRCHELVSAPNKIFSSLAYTSFERLVLDVMSKSRRYIGEPCNSMDSHKMIKIKKINATDDKKEYEYLYASLRMNQQFRLKWAADQSQYTFSYQSRSIELSADGSISTTNVKSLKHDFIAVEMDIFTNDDHCATGDSVPKHVPFRQWSDSEGHFGDHGTQSSIDLGSVHITNIYKDRLKRNEDMKRSVKKDKYNNGENNNQRELRNPSTRRRVNSKNPASTKEDANDINGVIVECKSEIVRKLRKARGSSLCHIRKGHNLPSMKHLPKHVDVVEGLEIRDIWRNGVVSGGGQQGGKKFIYGNRGQYTNIGLFDTGISFRHEGFWKAQDDYNDVASSVKTVDKKEIFAAIGKRVIDEEAMYKQAYFGLTKKEENWNLERGIAQESSGNLLQDVVRFNHDKDYHIYLSSQNTTLSSTSSLLSYHGYVRGCYNFTSQPSCKDHTGHGTFVAGVVGSRGVFLHSHRGKEGDEDGFEYNVNMFNSTSFFGDGNGGEKKEVLPPFLFQTRRKGGSVTQKAQTPGDLTSKTMQHRIGKFSKEVKPNKDCQGIAPDSSLYIFKTFTDEGISYTSYFLAAFNVALQLEIPVFSQSHRDTDGVDANISNDKKKVALFSHYEKLDVINLSMGGFDYEDFPFVQKIQEISAAGITVVNAAGNDGPHWGTNYNPSDQLDVISVGSVNHRNKVSTFSSRGMTTWELPQGIGRPKPDVMAYGDHIMGANLNGGCTVMTGTSVAAPVVTGSLSLVISAMKTPFNHLSSFKGSIININPALLKQIIYVTSDPLTSYDNNEYLVFEQSYLSSYLEKVESEGEDAVKLAGLFPPSPPKIVESDYSIFTQGAGLINVKRAVSLANSILRRRPVFKGHISTFPLNLIIFANMDLPLIYEQSKMFKYSGSRSTIRPTVETREQHCLYMWPLCDHSLFFTSSHLVVNLTVLNSYSAVARRRRCYASLGPWDIEESHSNFKRAKLENSFYSNILSQYIGVEVECSERLWPYSGTASVSFAVIRPFPVKKSTKNLEHYHTDGRDTEYILPSHLRHKNIHHSSSFPSQTRLGGFTQNIFEGYSNFEHIGAKGLNSSTEREGDEIMKYIRSQADIQLRSKKGDTLKKQRKGETDRNTNIVDDIGEEYITADNTIIMETEEYIAVEGFIHFEYEASSDTENEVNDEFIPKRVKKSLKILRHKIPFRVKVLKYTPPPSRRILFDMSHSLQYPPAYIPRDMGLSTSYNNDLTDWNGDHAYTNFGVMYRFLHSSNVNSYNGSKENDVYLRRNAISIKERMGNEQGSSKNNLTLALAQREYYIDHAIRVQKYHVDFLTSTEGFLVTLNRTGAPLVGAFRNDVIESDSDLYENITMESEYKALTRAWEGHQIDRIATSGTSIRQKDYSSLSSRYGVLLLIDPEDFYSIGEIKGLYDEISYGRKKRGNMKGSPSEAEDRKLWKDNNNGISLVLFSDWFNERVIKTMRGIDDNTRAYWEPLTGGSNIPAINELLSPWNIQLSSNIISGNIHPDLKFSENRNIIENEETSGKPHSTTPILDSGGTIHSIPVSKDNCMWCNVFPEMDGNIIDETPKEDINNANSGSRDKLLKKAPTLLFYQTDKHIKINDLSSPGRIAIFTDSSCLDAARHRPYPIADTGHSNDDNRGYHQPYSGTIEEYVDTFCFGLLERMLNFAMGDGEISGAAHGTRKINSVIKGEIPLMPKSVFCHRCGDIDEEHKQLGTEHQCVDPSDIILSPSSHSITYGEDENLDRSENNNGGDNVNKDLSNEEQLIVSNKKCFSFTALSVEGRGVLSPEMLRNSTLRALYKMKKVSWMAKRRLRIILSDSCASTRVSNKTMRKELGWENWFSWLYKSDRGTPLSREEKRESMLMSARSVLVDEYNNDRDRDTHERSDIAISKEYMGSGNLSEIIIGVINSDDRGLCRHRMHQWPLIPIQLSSDAKREILSVICREDTSVNEPMSEEKETPQKNSEVDNDKRRIIVFRHAVHDSEYSGKIATNRNRNEDRIVHNTKEPLNVIRQDPHESFIRRHFFRRSNKMETYHQDRINVLYLTLLSVFCLFFLTVFGVSVYVHRFNRNRRISFLTVMSFIIRRVLRLINIHVLVRNVIYLYRRRYIRRDYSEFEL